MKKIVLFISFLFILSGCEAIYNIDVDNNFNESIYVYPETEIEISKLKGTTYKHPAFYDPNHSEDEMYSRTDIQRYNTIFSNNVYTANYQFSKNYSKSNFAKTFTKRFGLVDDYLSKIYASDFSNLFGRYPGLKILKINIKISKNIVGHNADSVNGNVYTWVINRSNYKREIFINYINDDYKDKKNQSPGNNFNVSPSPNNNNSNNNKNSNKNNRNNSNNNVNSNNNNSKSDQKSTNSKKDNNVILYVLYALFFGGIFVIIVFRNKLK